MSATFFTVHQLIAIVACAMAAMILWFTSVLSFIEERRQDQRPMFALCTAALGWTVLTIGSASNGLGLAWAPLFAASPLFSGYIGPAGFLYTRQTLSPGTRDSLWLFLGGVPGTLFALTLLLTPGGLDWVVSYVFHDGPRHTFLLSLFAVHSASILGFCCASGVVVARRWMSPVPAARRTTLVWLALTVAIGMGMLLFSNLLPLMGITTLLPYASVFSLPLGLLGYQCLRGLSREMRIAKEVAEAARRRRADSLGRMARGVSHELNNHLAAIVGNAEVAMLKVGPQSVAQQRLDRIVQACQRAASLLHRLLSFSGRRDFAAVPVDPMLPVQRAVDAYQARGDHAPRLDLAAPGQLPPVRIDPADLQGAVAALLDNAAQATASGGTIRLRCDIARPDASVIP